METYSPTVLEARSLRSRYREGHVPSEDSRGGSFLPLPASDGPWHCLACGRIAPISACLHMLSSPVSVSSPPLPSLVRTFVNDFRAQPGNSG